MAKANRHRPARVNFFDGQRVTESDLDAEQIHHRSLASDSNTDFHASGVVRDRLFESQVLFDTSAPGLYSDDGNDATKFAVEAKKFDGKPLSVDRQPSDSFYGNRLEVEAKDLKVGGSIAAKVLIVGTTFSSINNSGEIVSEILEFTENGTKLTEYYYKKVITVMFNNLSGGAGRTEDESFKESEKTVLDYGRIILKESEPLKVFAKTDHIKQVQCPNIGLRSFITSNPANSIEDEIKTGLGASYNFNELYFELNSKEKLLFEKDGNQTLAYGQKFLAQSNNLQRVDLLFSVERDSEAALGAEYDFSGELVLSVHRLSSEVKCITDPQPNNLIDFDPEQAPIIEVAYDIEDLQNMGVFLDDSPKVVSFDLSGTLVADPNIEPSLKRDEFYAIVVSRRGDNRTGTVVMEKAYSKASRKRDNGQELNVVEQFGRRTTRFIEFDPNNSTFVDDEDCSLWFVLHSDCIEVTDGAAYTDDGIPVSMPKVEGYIGGTEVSRYIRGIDLKSISSDDSNLVILQRSDSFQTPSTHPRTGNFVNTRIKDEATISVVTHDEFKALVSADENKIPVVLAKVVDKNVREAQDIFGKLDKPGMISQDEIIFINPSSEALSSILVGRTLTPDTECSCSSKYKIVEANCEVQYAGDLDNDGKITNSDIVKLLTVVGNTINAETTERRILGGELDVVDFIKSDLNGDGTVDGDDISLIENATEGSFEFSVDKSFNLLRLRVENVSEKDNFPKIYSSLDDELTVGTASTATNDDEISFSVLKDEHALAIRVGDKVSVITDHPDSGEYLVYSKTVDETGLGVSVLVTDTSGEPVLLSGGVGLDLSVASGSKVNMLADNLGLLSVPFQNISWSITHDGSSHSEEFLDVCDLRRYVETNFIDESYDICKFDDESCAEEDDCSPSYRNQKVLANDLFLPDGEIYTKPGVPYHGDIEYASISIPLPPGTITDCAVDLYSNFIKSDGGSSKTAAGYPAMTYSDGTYVGCEDEGGNTDITKGRVKIDQCIASLHVDALVDGYAVDGYADEQDTYFAQELVKEVFVDHSYPNTSGFSQWPQDVTGTATVNAPHGPNQPAEFRIDTINTPYRYGRLSYPEGIVPLMSDDFVVDFTARRDIWPSDDLNIGTVYFYGMVEIENADGTSSDLKLGWKQDSNDSLKIFYKGVIKDTVTEQVISDFDFEIDAPDDLGDEIKFRLRRTDEAVFAMYYDKTLIDGIEDVEGQYNRIGGLVSVQPGAGDAKVNFEIAQDFNPTDGLHFKATLWDTVIKHSGSSEVQSLDDTLIISRDSDSLVNRLTTTFPILLTRRTNITSASLTLTAASAISTAETFNVILMI